MRRGMTAVVTSLVIGPGLGCGSSAKLHPKMSEHPARHVRASLKLDLEPTTQKLGEALDVFTICRSWPLDQLAREYGVGPIPDEIANAIADEAPSAMREEVLNACHAGLRARAEAETDHP